MLSGLRWMCGVAGVGALLSCIAIGQTAAPPYVPEALTGGKAMTLWPDGPGGANGAPGAQGNGAGDRPLLYVYLPKGPNATKTG